MARKPRKKSITDIYHIVLKGTGNQLIFEDDNDKLFFIRELDKCIDDFYSDLFAYCLMDNHVHLLLKIHNDRMEKFFKSLECRYVSFFNKKYDRHGHLFQDRYYSEPVESEKYFLAALRYILQNPVKAGICSRFFDYKWSSAKEYIYEDELITNVSFAKEIVGSRIALLDFLVEESEDNCLDIKECKHQISDEEAMLILKRICDCENLSEFRKMDRQKKYNRLLMVYKQGASIRQLSRLTGVSTNTIMKIVKNETG